MCVFGRGWGCGDQLGNIFVLWNEVSGKLTPQTSYFQWGRVWDPPPKHACTHMHCWNWSQQFWTCRLQSFGYKIEFGKQHCVHFLYKHFHMGLPQHPGGASPDNLLTLYIPAIIPQHTWTPIVTGIYLFQHLECICHLCKTMRTAEQSNFQSSQKRVFTISH